MKVKLSASALKTIVGRLDNDERCFIHPETGEVDFIPNFDGGMFTEEDWFDAIPKAEHKAEKARLKDIKKNWHEIPFMDTHEEFRVMEAFIDVVADQKMKDQLSRALKGKKPFANFKNELESVAKVRKQWFAFRDQAILAHLERQLVADGIDFEPLPKPEVAADGSGQESDAPIQLNQNMVLVQRLGRNHAEFLQEINGLFQEVFEYPTPPTGSLNHLERLLWSENIVAYGLLYEHELIGALTAYVLPGIYSDTPELFLYDIAIRKPYQRLGLGSRLLKTLRNYAKKHHISTVFVAVDDADIHALDFYRKNGGKASKVTHFEFGEG